MTNCEWIAEIFSHLENGKPQDYFSYVHDNVVWEVTGTHPLPSIFRSKQDFTSGTISKLDEVLESTISLKLLSCISNGKSASVELVANSVTKKGAEFHSGYSWVCEFESNQIVRVRAYLDSALVAKTLA